MNKDIVFRRRMEKFLQKCESYAYTNLWNSYSNNIIGSNECMCGFSNVCERYDFIVHICGSERVDALYFSRQFDWVIHTYYLFRCKNIHMIDLAFGKKKKAKWFVIACLYGNFDVAKEFYNKNKDLKDEIKKITIFTNKDYLWEKYEEFLKVLE